MKCIGILLLFVLFFGIFAVHYDDETETPSYDKPNLCQCAIFDSPLTHTTKKTAVPLIRHTNLLENCTKEDEFICKISCINLSNISIMKAPEIVCKFIGGANNLIIYLYSQACDKGWRYTDLASTNKLCCNNSLPFPCAGEKGVPKVLINNDKIKS